ELCKSNLRAKYFPDIHAIMSRPIPTPIMSQHISITSARPALHQILIIRDPHSNRKDPWQPENSHTRIHC
ncbi:hypothetical protein COCVIDRAFT_109063, partial [Bipolaris victoriae FI3]